MTRLQNSNPATYPLDKNYNLFNKKTLKGKEVEHLDYNNKAGFLSTILDTINVKQYQEMIGSLIYTVTRMQLDLAFTVICLSQFLTQPTKYHIRAAKHILRYLKKTWDLKLLFPLGQTQQHGTMHALTLEGITDLDFAGCPDTYWSISGYVFKLASATICWRNHKQRSVATSTLEAEYMALALATKQYLWLLKAIKELGFFNLVLNYSLSTDNTGANDLVHNPRISDKSKHI